MVKKIVPNKEKSKEKSKTKSKPNYFNNKTGLNEEQKKWCRCTLHVASKNSEKCNRSRNWGKNKCYNPYAVCSSRIHTSSGGKSCGDYYNFDNIPDNEIKAYGELLNIETGSRSTTLANIKKYKNY